MRVSITSSNGLRSELHARAAAREFACDISFGASASVVYTEDESGAHGNFLPASYRRIIADEQWARRLGKAYTANARLPRAQDRRRGELECASSSDALLMNIFCYPRALTRPQLCALLGIDAGLRPEFGVRAELPMRCGEVDRTELDMRLGDLLVEAKLTEGGFGCAARSRVERYTDFADVFAVEDLPWRSDSLQGYQVVRGVLTAHRTGGRFLLLCDARRPDLEEIWFCVLRAVHRSELRSRIQLLHWQELARVLSTPVRTFLAEKYGIIE